MRHPNYGHLEIFLLKFDMKSSISIVSSSEAKTCLLIVHVIEERATISTEIQRPAHSVQNIARMMLVLLNLPYLLETNCICLVLSTCFFPQLKLFNDSLSKSRFHNKCSFKGYRCRASKILYLGSCLSTKDIQRLRTNKRGSHFRKRASAAFSKESETPCSSTNILLC
jgi:hypothetical protein